MSTSQRKWQDLEDAVRTIAAFKFGAPARAEDIAGVRCDCVIHLPEGMSVLIEISKESTLEKLRTDLAKFAVLRNHFFAQGIFPKMYFVTEDDPTPSLVESGRTNHVNVFSVVQFLNAMLGADRYIHSRRGKQFGSAVDIYSGKPDANRYVRVNYYTDTGESYSAEKIASELVDGRTIILLGDYGSGKSRCVKEVFENLAQNQITNFRNPIAINLRDNWGLKRASEIITRHFTDLGLAEQVPDALKLAYSQATIYLLDGFDEIGAQTWSDEPTKLVDIRRQSLVGVKDLVENASGGILITGREHYFNDDGELVTCLGLDKKSPLILRCNKELTDGQFSEMLVRTTLNLPSWLPKKPLIATIIRDIDAAVVDNIFATSSGQVDFWELLITTFCEREARINPILDSSIIRTLYTHIGRVSRTTTGPLGPISIKQINEAFERATGRPPTDESAIILQRLPGLSRIGAESLDRQFVDTYILDGLKAEDVLGLLAQGGHEPLDLIWRNPVEEFGAFYIATRLKATNQVAAAAAFIRRHREAKNRILLSDLVAALFLSNAPSISLSNLDFWDGHFYQISFADAHVSDIHFRDCLFEYVDVTDAQPNNITIRQSMVMRMDGVTSKMHLPPWISTCDVGTFQSVSTLAAIREAGLTVAQTFLLSSLRKLFLQPGGGRKESSMYKGYGDSATKRICDKVIALLVREKFCQKLKGESEPLYIPNRSETGRVKAIMSQMTTSKDTLWVEVTRFG